MLLLVVVLTLVNVDGFMSPNPRNAIQLSFRYEWLIIEAVLQIIAGEGALRF